MTRARELQAHDDSPTTAFFTFLVIRLYLNANSPMGAAWETRAPPRALENLVGMKLTAQSYDLWPRIGLLPKL